MARPTGESIRIAVIAHPKEKGKQLVVNQDHAGAVVGIHGWHVQTVKSEAQVKTRPGQRVIPAGSNRHVIENISDTDRRKVLALFKSRS